MNIIFIKKFVVPIIVAVLLFSFVSAFWTFQSSDETAFDAFLDGFSGTNNFGLQEDPIINNLAVFSPDVLSNVNVRNMDLYSDDLVFVALSSDPKAVFKATTLAIWNDDVGLHSYPLLVIHEKDVFSTKIFLEDNDVEKLVFVGLPEIIDEDNFIKDLAINLGIVYEVLDYTDYKEYKKYWTSIVSVVGVTSFDYDNMLQATVFTGLNLPLVFLDFDIEKKLGIHLKFNPNKINVLLVGGYGGTLKSFEPVLLKNPSTALESHILFRNSFSSSIPLSEKIILYNPDDYNCVVVGGVFSGSDFVNSGFCRDSLLVPYLAVLHDQLVLPFSRSYKDDIFSLMDDLKNIKFKVNPSYVTFVGSPSAIPFGSDSIVARSLNPDGFVGVGRLLGVTVSDTSVLIMNSLKPVKFDSFFGYFNSVDLIGQAYVPPNVFALKNYFFDISFSSTNKISQTYIPQDYFIPSKKEANIIQAAKSDVIFIEGRNDLFLVDDNKDINSSVVFLVDDNSLNVESGVPFGLDLVRRGVRGMFGYPFQKVPSAEMKYFPLLFSYDFGEPVLFGDVNSLLNNFYLGNYPKSDVALVSNDLLFIGDPLAEFLPQKNNLSKNSKKNPLASSFLSDFPSQDSVLYGSYFDKFLSSSWDDSLKNIVVVNDLDVFDVSSIIFPLKDINSVNEFTVFPDSVDSCGRDSCSKFFSVVSLNPSAPFVQEESQNNIIVFPFKDSLPAFDNKLVFCVNKSVILEYVNIKKPVEEYFAIEPLSPNDWVMLKKYFVDDFNVNSGDICYIGDISLLEKASYSFDNLFDEFHQLVFVSDYEFNFKGQKDSKIISLSFSSPIFLAHGVSLESLFGELSIPIFIKYLGSDFLPITGLDNNKLLENIIPGRMYRINNRLVAYMGDNVFFDYDLSTAYTKTSKGYVEGLINTKYGALFEEYKFEMKNNNHNPLNYLVIEELYYWSKERVDKSYIAGSHCTPAPGTTEVYSCIGFVQAGLNFVFNNQYGGCFKDYSFTSCYSGLALAWGLTNIHFSVDIVGVDPSLPRNSFTYDSPSSLLRNINYFSLFFNSDLSVRMYIGGASDEYFTNLGIFLDTHDIMLSDSNIMFDHLSSYPRGVVIDRQNFNNNHGHSFFKGDNSNIIQASWESPSSAINEASFQVGEKIYYELVYPSGSRSALEDIDYEFKILK